MASDLSRLTFDQKKHYSGVLLQQGRVLLDADWNEQLAIAQYRTHTQTRDVIGESGVPKNEDAFKITLLGTDNFEISSGHIYVGGLLCELENGEQTTYLDQPYYSKTASPLLLDLPSSPPNSPLNSPPTDIPSAYLVYIDAWQREITYLDDPRIQEVALGEADTATRLQTVWQVKLLPLADDAACETELAAWNDLIAPSTGKLNVQTVPDDQNEDPCLLPPNGGYRRLENQLYRIEIQKGGDLGTATFKWSRDNASVETIIEDIQGDILIVESIGKDDVLGFAADQWVEIVDEVSTLNSQPRPLIQIDSVDAALREITLKPSGNSLTFKKGLKLRRWDQNGGADGLTTDSEPIPIEDGIEVNFSAGTYRAGDYWLIPARTETADVEWMKIDDLPVAQLPRGVHHAYCKLGIIKVEEGEAVIEDCRPIFPSLTEICAEDICFDSSNCGLTEAETVQEVLDDLCQSRGGSCTYHVSPGAGWERVFDRIKDKADAQICFQVGDYVLDQPKRIEGKGHLKLTGCGFGTRILATSSEAALVFDDCSSVLIRDVYAETGRADFRRGSRHLNGTFTFVNCPLVNVQDVRLKCGAAASRAATCLTVRNDDKTVGDVRIQNSEFSIGHYQQGILLVNVRQAWVENNRLTAYAKPSRLNYSNMIKDVRYRREIRSLLIAESSLKGSTEKTNVRLGFNNHDIHFKTYATRNIVPTWSAILEQNPPKRAVIKEQVLNHTKRLADKILLDENFRRKFPPFRQLVDNIRATDFAVATQGITVGGKRANDIRIVNNSIEKVLQGIHVGLSHQNDDSEPYQSQNLLIAGNSVTVHLPPTVHKTERYGIFVGNCKNLVIEDNTVLLLRIELPNSNNNDIPITGIHVWGAFGKRLLITKNYVDNIGGNSKLTFNTAIRVEPLAARPRSAQWAVTWNVAIGNNNNIQTSNGVINRDNTP